MRRTPSKVSGFSPLVSSARGVTSRPHVDRRRRLARRIFVYEKKKFVNQENVSKKISANLMERLS